LKKEQIVEEKARKILEEYIQNVEEVCRKLLDNLNRTQNLSLKTKWDFFDYRAQAQQVQFEANGISYRLHGKGCTAFNEKLFLDWDYGYRSRWCGINPWKVAMTLKKSNCNDFENYDGNKIQNICEQAVAAQLMFKQYNQYYFTIPEDEMFKPSFPKEFDTLVIEYGEQSWSIPRNKVIDRFLRKCTKISMNINKNENKYILKFIFNEEEVYSVPYDDIGYPENAIKIMSDEVLKNPNKYMEI
jgi:hypothetical protein